jgi:glutamyl/glutaminyl-tRNA synthetase
MALIGWTMPDEREIMNLSEMEQTFDIKKMRLSGAAFDYNKLDWINGEYIRKTPITELTDLCVPYIEKSLGIVVGSMPRSFLEAVVSLEQPRLKKLSDIGEKVSYFFNAPVYEKELLRWKNQTDQETKDALAQADNILADIPMKASALEIETAFFSVIGEGDKGVLLWPLRVALTGKKASPGPFEIIAVMERNEARSRIARAQALLQ